MKLTRLSFLTPLNISLIPLLFEIKNLALGMDKRMRLFSKEQYHFKATIELLSSPLFLLFDAVDEMYNLLKHISPVLQIAVLLIGIFICIFGLKYKKHIGVRFFLLLLLSISTSSMRSSSNRSKTRALYFTV